MTLGADRRVGDTLTRGLEALGLDSGGTAREKLEIYLGELRAWNPVFGLTGARQDTEEALITRHILDSLAGLSFIQRGASSSGLSFRLADVGSGAGLPGIPLAVFLPRAAFTLIEPSVKRCAFLRSAIALMKMENAGVFEGDLASVREAFPIVTFRAFRPLDGKMLKKLLAILKPEGFIAAYKARAGKTESETAAARELGLEARAETLTVPFLNEERRLLIIKRIITRKTENEI
jgi:16S rRNA (guanine527-N7)-methyltransferase